MLFKERLKFIRKHNNDTQETLATNLGIDRTAITKMESGVTSPNIETLLKISDLYGVSVDFLLGRKDYGKWTWSLVDSYSIQPEEAEKLLLKDTFEDMFSKMDVDAIKIERKKDLILNDIDNFLKNNPNINISELKNLFSELLDMCNNPSNSDELNAIIKILSNLTDYSEMLKTLIKIPFSSVSLLEKFISNLINNC